MYTQLCMHSTYVISTVILEIPKFRKSWIDSISYVRNDAVLSSRLPDVYLSCTTPFFLHSNAKNLVSNGEHEQVCK